MSVRVKAKLLCRRLIFFFFLSRNLLAEHPDKFVILKFSAPWCQACRALAEKFKPFMAQIGLPAQNNREVVFADISCSSQQSGVHCDTLGVVHLPSVQFYAPGVGREPLESFACGPNHLTWPQLKGKMMAFVESGPTNMNDNLEQTTVVPSTSAVRAVVSWMGTSVRRFNPFSNRKSP